MSISENSRYRRSLIVHSLSSLGTLSRRPWVSRYPTPDDLPIIGLSVHEVKQSDTWNTLGAQFFGNSRLWWVFTLYNPIIDPFDFLKPGVNMYVPSRNIVYFDVLDVDEPSFEGTVT